MLAKLFLSLAIGFWVAYPLYTSDPPSPEVFPYTQPAQYQGGDWLCVKGIKCGTAGIPYVVNGQVVGYATANHVLSKNLAWNDIQFGDYYYTYPDPGSPVGFSAGYKQINKNKSNYIDIALAYTTAIFNAISSTVFFPDSFFSPEIKDLGQYQIDDYAKCHADFTQIVQKVGAASGLTEGMVVGCNDTIYSEDESGQLVEFEEQIRIISIEGKPFAIPGDSGSAVIDKATNKLLGMVAFGDGYHIWAGNLNNIER